MQSKLSPIPFLCLLTPKHATAPHDARLLAVVHMSYVGGNKYLGKNQTHKSKSSHIETYNVAKVYALGLFY